MHHFQALLTWLWRNTTEVWNDIGFISIAAKNGSLLNLDFAPKIAL